MNLQTRAFFYFALLLVLTGLWYGLKPLERIDDLTNLLKPTITILAGGDVSLGRQTGQKILAGEIDYPFLNIAETSKSADITFINLESQLADLNGETQSPTSEYRFAGPPEGALTLRNAGVDIVSVANNHMWDYGQSALKETLDNLRAQEVLYVGASMEPANRFEPKVLESKGKKIAFFAMTELLNGYENSGASEFVAFNDSEKLIEAVKSIKDSVDWVFVSLHAGAEYVPKPSSGTVELAHTLIDAGADAVIGHHPHVPQPIEIYNGKPIFYSLGNFAFWQPFTFWTQNSFLVKFKLTEPHKVDYEIVPVKAGWQPQLLTDSDAIEQLMERVNSSGEDSISLLQSQ